MIPGNARAAFIPNFPSSDAKALSFDLTHFFKPLFLGGGSPPPDSMAANMYPYGHPNSREYGSNCNSLLSKQSSDLFT